MTREQKPQALDERQNLSLIVNGLPITLAQTLWQIAEDIAKEERDVATAVCQFTDPRIKYHYHSDSQLIFPVIPDQLPEFQAKLWGAAPRHYSGSEKSKKWKHAYAVHKKAKGYPQEYVDTLLAEPTFKLLPSDEPGWMRAEPYVKNKTLLTLLLPNQGSQQRWETIASRLKRLGWSITPVDQKRPTRKKTVASGDKQKPDNKLHAPLSGRRGDNDYDWAFDEIYIKGRQREIVFLEYLKRAHIADTKYHREAFSSAMHRRLKKKPKR